MTVFSKSELKPIVLLILALLPGGCSALLLKNFDRAAAQDIHKIALLDVNELQEYQIISRGAAKIFLLPSGAAGTPGFGFNSKTLTKALADQNLMLGHHLNDAITSELQAHGYEVVHAHADRKPNFVNGPDFLSDYAAIKVEADAILDVVINDGGFSQGGDGNYYAYVYTKARLIKLPQRQTLYSERSVVYLASGRTATINRDAHGFGQGTPVSTFEQPDIGDFRTYSDILADVPRSAAALKTSVEPLASYYGQTLQH